MYSRKSVLQIILLTMAITTLAACGETQSGQSGAGTAEVPGAETVDVAEDTAKKSSLDQPKESGMEPLSGQPGEGATESSSEQPKNGVTESSTDQPKDSEVESETKQTSREWRLSVPMLPAVGCELSDFVPEGWELMDSVELDYNGDGIADYVGVQEVPPDKENDGWWYYSPGFRILFAIASDGPGQYRLDFQDENLIRTWDEGGTFGDPYEPLTAEGNSFTTHAYGGSSWKWSEAYTYTYRDGTWYLTWSEYFYGYGLYTTDYVMDDWDRGVRTRTTRSSDFSDMEKHWGEHEGLEDDGEYDLAYEMRLDEPFTLYQAGKRWWLAPDRVMDWEVREIVLAEGIELSQEMIKMPENTYLHDYCDEDCVLYTFSGGGQDDQQKCYLAMYRWQDKSLHILAEEDSLIDAIEVYEHKVYYSTEVIKHIAYKSVKNGEDVVKERDDGIGMRLNRINMDGAGKEIVFEYLCPGTDQQILEGLPPYMALITDISGGEIVIEVYIENSGHPVFRMNVDGSDLRQIGQIPRE